jgi:large subunit ribosomal protein L10
MKLFAPDVYLRLELFLFKTQAGTKQTRSAMADKKATVAELKNAFSSSSAVILTEYRGLTVTQLKELRRALANDATYVVAKNTLLTIAAKEAGVTAFDGQLFGPSALTFVHGDAVSAAKALKEFAKANPLLVVKTGVMDGIALSEAEVKKLSDLESREVLLAKAAGALKASLFKAAYTFNALPSGTVRVVDALRQKQESN